MERTALDAPCVPVSFTIGELRAIMEAAKDVLESEYA
jgi:hypothetical protein